MNPDTLRRFWEKVNKTDTCWNWTGSKRNKGYGAFVFARPDGKVVQGRAHRFSYEIHKEEIPKGLFVLHKCDNPACVNPDHLFLGTNQDNVDDMMRKGRHVAGGTYSKANYERGENHHAAKLTQAIVAQIREDKDKLSYSQLSRKYGCSIGHLHKIVTRKVWK